MRVFRFDGIAGLDWQIGKSIAGAHEVSNKLRIQDLDLGEPLARCSANPTGDERTSREAMMLRERGAVHVGSDQRVGVECFLDRYAANEGRNFARNFVEPAEHHVLPVGLHSGTLKNIAKTRA